MINMSEDTTQVEPRFLTGTDGVTEDTQPSAPPLQVEDPEAERNTTLLRLACGCGVLSAVPCATATECRDHGLQAITSRTSLVTAE